MLRLKQEGCWALADVFTLLSAIFYLVFLDELLFYFTRIFRILGEQYKIRPTN